MKKILVKSVDGMFPRFCVPDMQISILNSHLGILMNFRIIFPFCVCVWISLRGEDFLRSVQLSPAIHIFVSSFSIFIHFMSSYVSESVKIEF